jgi:transcriptional regulator with XRE-family HTH domain
MTRARARATVPPGRDELAETIGARARAARKAAGWTQGDVATQVGLVTQVYGRLERGGMLPSVETLRKLALVLELSADDLLGIHRRLSAEGKRFRRQEGRPSAQQLIRLTRGLDTRTLRLLLTITRALIRAAHN